MSASSSKGASSTSPSVRKAVSCFAQMPEIRDILDSEVPPTESGSMSSEAPPAQIDRTSLDDPHLVRHEFVTDEYLLENLASFLRGSRENDPQYSAVLAEYAWIRFRNYEKEGKIQDLLAAVDRFEQSVATTPEGDPQLAYRLYVLGHVLETKFHVTAQLEDLNNALERTEQAIFASSKENPGLPQWIQELAGMYRLRYEHDGDRIEDLEKATLMSRWSVENAPEYQPNILGWINNLACQYEWLFDRKGRMEDLEEAIGLGEKIVDVTPDDDPLILGRLHNLAKRYEMRYDRTHEIEDLQRAIMLTAGATRLANERELFWMILTDHWRSMERKLANSSRLEASGVTSASVEDPRLVYPKIYSNLQLASDQIRLLSIKAPVDGVNEFEYPSPICSLRIINLKQPPPYIALSYTWGSQPFDHTLEVNGQTLSVTRSCHDALRMLAVQGCTDVWIDQICIDQSNLLERGQQVSLMDQIYRGASSVYIWLGRTGNDEWMVAQDSGPLIFQFDLKSKYRRGHRIDSNPSLWQKLLPWCTTSALSQSSGSYNLDNTISLTAHLGELFRNKGTTRNEELLADEWAWVGFVDILARPYYCRRWTIQEHSSSSEIHVLFGNRKIEWKVIWEAATCLYLSMRSDMEQWIRLPIPDCCGPFLVAIGEDLENLYVVIGLKIAAGAREQIEVPLLELLRKCKGTRNMDPHDKIYALLSLAAERKQLPQADYTEPAADVVRECITQLIHMGQGSQVLLLAGHRPSRVGLGLLKKIQMADTLTVVTRSQTPRGGDDDFGATPTWCPHFLWDLHPTSYPLCWADFNKPEELTNAVGDTKCQITYRQPNQLVVEGSIIDDVVAIQRILIDRGPDYDEFLIFQDFANLHTKHNDVGIYENKLIRQAVQRMASLGHISRELQDNNKYDKVEIALRMLQIPIAELPGSPTIYRDLALFVAHTMIKENRNRRLCATAQGYIGLCSYDARPGDKVALLHGVSMLMVLRPVAENTYEIIGDSYFSCISNGDALKLATYQPGELFIV